MQENKAPQRKTEDKKWFKITKMVVHVRFFKWVTRLAFNFG